MSEDRKRQAKAWALVSTGDVDAEEHVRSIEDKISKGQCSLGKQMCFCTHHIRLNCKRMCRAHVNQMVLKVWEESGSHDRGAMLEDHKGGLPNDVKEQSNEALEANENIAQKHKQKK